MQVDKWQVDTREPEICEALGRLATRCGWGGVMIEHPEYWKDYSWLGYNPAYPNGINGYNTAQQGIPIYTLYETLEIIKKGPPPSYVIAAFQFMEESPLIFTDKVEWKQYYLNESQVEAMYAATQVEKNVAQQGEWQVDSDNAQINDTLLYLAQKQGWMIHNHLRNTFYRFLIFYPISRIVGGNYEYDDNIPPLSLKETLIRLSQPIFPEKKELLWRTSGGYAVNVDYDKKIFQIGCLNITFAQVEEVFHTMQDLQK